MEFNPFCNSLNVTFTCPCCGEEITYRVDEVPEPDWMGEDDGLNDGVDEFVCPTCGAEIVADMFVNEHRGLIFLSTPMENGAWKDVPINSLQEINMTEEEFESCLTY